MSDSDAGVGVVPKGFFNAGVNVNNEEQEDDDCFAGFDWEDPQEAQSKKAAPKKAPGAAKKAPGAPKKAPRQIPKDIRTLVTMTIDIFSKKLPVNFSFEDAYKLLRSLILRYHNSDVPDADKEGYVDMFLKGRIKNEELYNAIFNKMDDIIFRESTEEDMESSMKPPVDDWLKGNNFELRF